MYFYIVKIFDKHERAELNSTDWYVNMITAYLILKHSLSLTLVLLHMFCCFGHIYIYIVLPLLMVDISSLAVELPLISNTSLRVFTFLSFFCASGSLCFCSQVLNPRTPDQSRKCCRVAAYSQCHWLNEMLLLQQTPAELCKNTNVPPLQHQCLINSMWLLNHPPYPLTANPCVVYPGAITLLC